MSGLVAVGGPAWSVSGGFDFTGLLWVAAAILVTRFVLELPLTIPTVSLSLIAATLWWAAVERWGLLVPVAMLSLGLWLLSRALPEDR
jgi:hypothetical protein